MTTTTTEILTVGGVVLNTLANNIESIAGRLTIPPKVTTNTQVPSRHGRLRAVRKYFDEGQLILPMWVKGCDDNGAIPTGKTERTMFFNNVDKLSQLFYPGSGQIEMLHTLPDASVRRAWCEVLDILNFTVDGFNPLGKFSVSLRVPGSFWEDQSASTVALTPVWNGQIAQFDGNTAPVEDSVFTIHGPCTSIKIQALYNGLPLEADSWFQYTGALSATQTLTVDCGTWTLTGGGGYVPNYALLTSGGSPRWLTLVANVYGQSPAVKITSAGTTGATTVSVTAKRKFLVG